MNYNDIWTAKSKGFATQEEETAATLRAQQGDPDATQSILVAYRPLMLTAIRQYRPVWNNSGMSGFEHNSGVAHRAADDIYSAAVLGILQSVQDWHPDTHPTIAGIAPSRVFDEVRAVAGDHAAFSIPRRTKARFFGIAKRSGYDLEEGTELAPLHGMSADTFRAVWAAVMVDSLDDRSGPDSADGEPSDADGWETSNVASVTGDGTNPELLDEEDAQLLTELAFKAVDDTEHRVCELAYGFAEPDPQPDAEIAHRMGMPNRLKALRVRNGALDKMRSALAVEIEA